MSNKIKMFILEKLYKINIQKIDDNWSKIFNLYKKYINGYNMSSYDRRMIINLYRDMLDLTGQITVLIMDAYLLARLFRTFRGTSHVPSDIKIIYAGRYHIRHYIEFIEKNLKVLDKYEAIGQGLDCIYVDITQFLS